VKSEKKKYKGLPDSQSIITLADFRWYTGYWEPLKLRSRNWMGLYCSF